MFLAIYCLIHYLMAPPGSTLWRGASARGSPLFWWDLSCSDLGLSRTSPWAECPVFEMYACVNVWDFGYCEGGRHLGCAQGHSGKATIGHVVVARGTGEIFRNCRVSGSERIERCPSASEPRIGSHKSAVYWGYHGSHGEWWHLWHPIRVVWQIPLQLLAMSPDLMDALRKQPRRNFP